MSAWDDAVDEGLVQRDVGLAALTTYKFGGPARYFAELHGPTDVAAVAALLRAVPQPVLVLGRGSNLVVSDHGFDGLVIRLAGKFLEIEHCEDGSIRAGGAVPLPRLARSAVKEGRGGLEFYVGVPGSVGGAVRMNAGCHGTETGDVLLTATVMDLATGSVRTVGPDDLELTYRHSNLDDDDVVTTATFGTTPIDPATGERIMREITAWRKHAQPGGTYNAGSVFKNPPGDAAGRLIDAAGLKGFRVGGVAVSEKHANFFVAGEEASAQDVFDLVTSVRRQVREATGIDLQPEVKFAGRFAGAERSGGDA